MCAFTCPHYLDQDRITCVSSCSSNTFYYNQYYSLPQCISSCSATVLQNSTSFGLSGETQCEYHCSGYLLYRWGSFYFNQDNSCVSQCGSGMYRVNSDITCVSQCAFWRINPVISNTSHECDDSCSANFLLNFFEPETIPGQGSKCVSQCSQ